jgi:hypothetical protein
MRLYSAIWAIVLLCCLAGPAAAATEVKRYRAWDSLGDPTGARVHRPARERQLRLVRQGGTRLSGGHLTIPRRTSHLDDN